MVVSFSAFYFVFQSKTLDEFMLALSTVTQFIFHISYSNMKKETRRLDFQQIPAIIISQNFYVVAP